jgi:cytochrome c oxidase subunit 2
MGQSRTRWWLMIAVAVVVGVILLCCVALAGALFLAIPTGTRTTTYGSNGEQIYFTATSQRGTPITYQTIGGMPMMRTGTMACVTCHNADGRGGRQSMMMRTFDAPDIRYKALTAPRLSEGGEPEPVFTDATIRQAITDGTEPDGEPLQWPMPRWSMRGTDLDDLLAFLRSLP